MSENKLLTVDDIKLSLQNFCFIDYTIFAIILLVSCGIGIYFGFFQNRKKSYNKNVKECEEEYLMGGRSMHIIPVSFSVIASFISGISLLGHATETYVYGTKMAFQLFFIFTAVAMAWFVFLPIYCELKLTSIFEYFEMRFDKRIRTLGSFINIVSIKDISIISLILHYLQFLWLPLVIYMPGLVFNQVSGIGVHVVTPIISFVCIFYTCIGGIKAVVWTDVLQSGIMFGTVVIIIIKGTIDAGGIREVYNKNYESGRILLPELSIDPRVRISLIAALLNGYVSWTDAVCCGQMMMQRYLSVPTLKSARKVALIFSFGALILIGCCIYNGMLLYAYYHDCDPLTTKLAVARDQLLPLFFMDILGNVPGLPGIFVAGIFSAALSSLSSGLNSLSAIVLEDFVKPYFASSLNDKILTFIMRLIVVVFGALIFGMVFIVEHLGMVLQLGQTLSSVTSGPMFSLFIMGVFLPWINGKSALTGGVTAFIMMSIICVLRQVNVASGSFRYLEMPVSTDGCEYVFEPYNSTTSRNEYDLPMRIEHISFLWYSTIGAFTSILFANIASLVFGRVHPKDVNLKLIAPCIRKFYQSDIMTTDEELKNLSKK